MGNPYTRQSAAEILDGEIITATPLNNEFNTLRDAFDNVNGHSHDGTTGESQKISLTGSVSGILPIANGGSGVSTGMSVATQNAISGFRNKIINGDFDIWQRTSNPSITSGYYIDRWNSQSVGSTNSSTRLLFTNGQTTIPGNPTWYTRVTVSSVVGANNYSLLAQPIEDVRILSGKQVTITFYAKADASRSIGVEITQNFGSGGSPSAVVSIPVAKVNLTTSWQKFSLLVDIPSITGKTIGSDINSKIIPTFWFDAGSSFATRASVIGHQSGTFDMAHVSFVEGDATSETDPFSARHIQQELALCQRYYCVALGNIRGYSPSVGSQLESTVVWPVTMRTTPSVVGPTGATNSLVNSVSLVAPSTRGSRFSLSSSGTGDAYSLNGTITADAEI